MSQHKWNHNIRALGNIIYSNIWRFVLIGYLISLSLQLLLKYKLFFTEAFDLGIFSQSLWTTATYGRLLFNTPEFMDLGVTTHFGVHFQPILLMLVPFYRVTPNPESLLLLVSLSLFVSGLLYYRFSKQVLGNKSAASFFVVFFVLSPFSWIVDDFHPVVLGVPIAFLLTWSLHRYFVEEDHSLRNKFIIILSSILFLSVKEDSGLFFISIGLMYILLENSDMRIRELFFSIQGIQRIINSNKAEIFIICVGILSMTLTSLVIIPSFNPSNEYVFLSSTNHVGKMYLSRQNFEYRVIYLSVWFLYFGVFLVKRSRFMLSLLPLLLELLVLGSWPPVIIIGTHYSYMLIVMSFVTSVYIFREIELKLSSGELTELKKIILIDSIILFLLFSPVLNLSHSNDVWGPTLPDLVYTWNHWSPYTEVLEGSLKYLENTNCTLIVQRNLFPQLANRMNTYVVKTVFGKTYLENNSIVLLDSMFRSQYNVAIEGINESSVNTKSLLVVDMRLVIRDCALESNTTDAVLSCVHKTLSQYIKTCGDTYEGKQT